MVAVLIATCDRPGLLAQRSLSSVQRQTRRPNFLVVVDDSDPTLRPDNRNIVNDLRLGGARIVYIANTRTRGASGAWNTGLEWLRRHAGDPRNLFVAVLDDDDEWEPDHLALCAQAVTARRLDMVAPAIVRISSDQADRTQLPPEDLDPALFLVGNPHIQGSNLFLRLSALLEAGAFDESLTSSTDRDLCIRLADLGSVRYAPIQSPTVRHHADTHRPRLSSPTGDPKKRGLDRFWTKWAGRMTDSQRDACLQRSKSFFGWALSPTAESPPPPAGSYVPIREPTCAEIAHADDLVLVVGVITDPDHASQFCSLLGDLLNLQAFDHICGLDVVVLHNGGPPQALDPIVAEFRARGLAIFLASEAQQTDDARAGAFGQGFTRPVGRAPIGPARTMLQTYVTRVASQRSGAIAWILDDDSSLTNLTDGPTPQPFSSLLSSLKRMQCLGVDVVLGTVSGDPPVPPGSTVRTQLVDLYHNLAWLQNLAPNSTLPNRSADNRATRAAARDFYYDLSRRDTHHLEWPFWLTPSHASETVREATARMLAALPRILAGQAVFRPLLLETDQDTIASMRPSVQRGTNTFVFDLGAFSDFPNAAPSFAGSTLRRSDMIWALLNRYAGGRRIVSATLPVRHDRSSEAPVGLDLNRLVPDIRGYALYSALEDVLVRRRERRLRDGIGAEHPDDLKFREADLDLGVARFRKYLTERTAALLLSCWRIQGLCEATVRHANTTETPAAATGLLAFLAQARAAFDTTAVQKAVNQVLAVPPEEVRSFFRSLPAMVENHKNAAAVLPHKDAWFNSEREASARALAQAVTGLTPLRLLGAGGEGVVFESGGIVIKVIDYSKRSPANGARDGIAKLAASTAALSGLYRITLPAAPGGRQVLCYPFEPSAPYRGGRATDILQILRDCRAAGIVTTNFHPKNLAVTQSGVKLIDYGSDIRPFTDEYYATMAQRAWLTLHHHDREDLATLMRRALGDNSLPELEGWEALLAAADAPTKREVIDEALLDIVRPWKPRKVLDFGCGHGRLAAALATDGTQVTAYDPDESLRTRWNQFPKTNGTAIRWLSGPPEDALSGMAGSFDTVICSLVLCVIEPEAEYRSALRRISDALPYGGRFAIVVCNPEATLDGDTTLQRRLPPPGATASQVFTWCKHLPSGTQRQDVHRPLPQLARDLRAVGLTINNTTTTGGLSLDRFQPSRDFLILCGKKAPGPAEVNGHQRNRKPRALHRCPGNPPILCYHRILPEAHDDAISRFQRRRGTVVDLAVFIHQLDEIRHFFTPISLSDYISWLCDGASLPQDACLLTFDDGYRDFLDFALPSLKQRGIPCALFPTVSAARGEALLPTDSLYAALSKAECESRLSPDQVLDWVAGANKRRYIHADLAEQRRLLEEAALEPVAIAAASLYITEQEIASLPPGLVAIGGHGCRHELLANKELPALRAELRKVRLWLENLTVPRADYIPTLAYPNGAQDPVAISAAIEAGFAAAFTVEPWQPARTDHRWRLGRSCVPNQASAIADLVAGKELRI